MSSSGSSSRAGRPAAGRRALTVRVSKFGGAETKDGVKLEDLTMAPELVPDLERALRDIGYETTAFNDATMSSEELGAEVQGHWDGAQSDDILIVHVLSHGHAGSGRGTVYALGSDGVVHRNTDVDHWLKDIQDGEGRPLTLILLDLCSSGIAARLPWQQAVEADDSRAWVIAASMPDQAAFDGRFTKAVTKALRALQNGELDTDPSLEHVPLAIVARTIRQEVNALSEADDGYPQQVTASMIDLSADPHLPFFRNPSYSGDKQAQLRAKVDAGLLPFLDDIDEGLDPRHFLERAAGVGGLAPEAGGLVGCFTGRDRELRQLSRWMNGIKDEQLSPGPLCLVTGSPGVGKSALLGVLVCAAHRALRGPTKPVWDRVAQSPNPIERLAAVHARRRSVASVVASIARQLGLESLDTFDALAAALRQEAGPTPVVVVDALDEAEDGPALMTGVLLPLSALVREDGDPATRLLVGVRDYEEYAELMGAARAINAVIDLDMVPPSVLEDDLNRYVIELLRTTEAYRHRGGVSGAFASTLASVLTPAEPDGGGRGSMRWGPFLVAGLYTRHMVTTTAEQPITDPADAERLADQAPRDLPSLLELDLAAQTDQPLLRPIMSVLAHACGQGMPVSLIARTVTAFSGGDEAPSVAEVLETLEKGRVYLRQSPGSDGTTVYRLFHQGLVDSLGQRPFEQAAGLLEAMLAPLGPPSARDWDAAEPYVLRHLVEHAEDAGLVEEVLSDPGLLLRPEGSGLLEQVDLSAHPELQALAELREGPGGDSRAAWVLRAARAGLTGFAARAANLPGQPPLAWQPRWTVGRPAAASAAQTVDLPGGQATGPDPQEEPVRSLALSADGAMLAYYTEGGGLRLWDREAGPRHGAPAKLARVTSMAMTPSGRHVVFGDITGAVRVWDNVAGTTRFDRSGSAPVSAVAISDDARQVMAIGSTGDRRVWNLTRRQVRVITGSAPGAHVMRSGKSEVVVHAIPARPGLTAAAASDDGGYLVTGSVDGTVSLWPATRGEAIASRSLHDGRVVSVALALDGSHVASGGEDGAVVLWDPTTGTSAAIGLHQGGVACVAISRDGRTVASGGTDGVVRVWDNSGLAAGMSADVTGEGGRTGQNVRARAMAIAAGAVVVADDQGRAYPFELATGRPAREPFVFDSPVTHLGAELIDGHHGVHMRHTDENSLVWLPQTDSLIPAGAWSGFAHSEQARAASLTFLLGDQLVRVEGELDGRLVVRDLAGPYPDESAPAPDGETARADCARLGGRLIAATSAGDHVHIWDVAERQLTDTIDMGGKVWDLRLSADGHLLVGTGDEIIVFQHARVTQAAAP